MSTAAPVLVQPSVETMENNKHNNNAEDQIIHPGLQLLSKSYTLDRLDEIIDKLRDSVKNMMQDETSGSMLASCITRLPSGEEKGTFLSVDLGGSTARVAFIRLYGKNEHETLYKASYPVSNEIKSYTGKGFFLWIAGKIQIGIDYAISQNWLNEDYDDLITGISWSFPFKQLSVDRGCIQAMGKGYGVTDEIMNWDLKESFEWATKELGIRINVKAIVNDTTASLISYAYGDPTTNLSLILGTGINSCGMYELSSFSESKLKGLHFEEGASYCLVNTESSMFGAGIIPDTCWDEEIDRCNERPGYQPLEQKVSGRYIGEISRLIIRDLVRNGLLCNGVMPEGFEVPYGFKSSVMSDMEQEMINNRPDEVRNIFLNANPIENPSENFTDNDLKLISSVITSVSTRAAALTAATLVALATLLPESVTQCTIAYDGTMVEKYPNFRQRCQDYLDTLGAPRGRKLILKPSTESSLLGPAIASAMFAEKD